VLPARAVTVDDQYVLFEVDAAAVGEAGWRFQYPLTAENVTWGCAGESDSATTAAALMAAYGLGDVSPLPPGPTGAQGPRISAVWL
jgi:hypothetical protein